MAAPFLRNFAKRLRIVNNYEVLRMVQSNTSLKSNPKLFQWALVGVLVAGASYYYFKKYHVVYCKEHGCDPKEDPLDKLATEVKAKLETVGSEFWDKIQDNILDEHMKEALDFITSILEKLKQFDMPEVEYKVPRIVLLALIKKTQEYMKSQEMNQGLEQRVHMSVEDFEDAKKMGQFALNVYAASWAWQGDAKEASVKMGIKDDKDQVLMTWFADKEGQAHCPKFMVFTDNQSKSIVLAIRGTFSLADVIVDVVCDEDEFLDGFAHRGILKGARKIIEESGHVIQNALQENPDYRLVVTGHSLGAGTAILVSMELLAGQFKSIVNPFKTKIKCFALAPPPVYRSSSKIERFKENIDIFINGNDVVPRLSLANMAKLLAMLRAIDQVPLTPQDHMKIIAGMDETNLEILSQVLKKVDQNQFPKLDHPGRIFYLHPNADDFNEYLIMTTTGSFFSGNLFLLENMVLHHLQPYYEEAFAKVKIERLRD